MIIVFVYTIKKNLKKTDWYPLHWLQHLQRSLGVSGFCVNGKITGLFRWKWCVYCSENGKQRNSTISNIWLYWTFDCSSSAGWQISSHGKFYSIFTISEGKKSKEIYWNYTKRIYILSQYRSFPSLTGFLFSNERSLRLFLLRKDFGIGLLKKKIC